MTSEANGTMDGYKVFFQSEGGAWFDSGARYDSGILFEAHLMTYECAMAYGWNLLNHRKTKYHNRELPVRGVKVVPYRLKWHWDKEEVPEKEEILLTPFERELKEKSKERSE